MALSETRLAPFVPLAGASVALALVRIYAAGKLGYGDAEALYASYAVFPQPAYLDHPGLIGSVARTLGGGGPPSPRAAHLFSTAVATLVPWLGAAAALAAGATPRRSAVAGIALLAAPVLTVGLFAFTPDLVLCPLWLVTLGAVAFALRAPPSSGKALGGMLVAGGAIGLACDAKVTGVLLAIGLGAALCSRAGRGFARHAGPWLALALASLLVAPVVVFEAENGFPMVAHRLVTTQARAGFSPRNAAALIGGQLGYVSPLLCAVGVFVARELWRRRDAGALACFFRALTAVTTAALAALCLWSRVAEPHWFAPAWLALPVYAAAFGVTPPRRWLGAAFGVGAALSLAAHTLVLTDLAPRLLGVRYVPRFDLANDLYTWPAALPAVREAVDAARETDVGAALIAPHWTIAAQLQAGLGAGVRVGTAGGDDDFAHWLPPALWSRRDRVVWVSDDRFGDARPFPLDGWATERRRVVEVERGGRVVRRVYIETLLRADTG